MVFLWSILIFGGLLAALAAGLTVAERKLLHYGRCRIDINAGERPLDVDGGQTLLSALYGGSIFIPSACGGKGSCGYCKVKVVSGGGPVLPTELPYLNRRDVRAGLRLACQVKVRQDLAMLLPEELLNVRLYSAVVTGSRDLTYDIKEIRLALIEPAEIKHRPGQYVQVRAPSPEGPVFRAYSISSPVQATTVIELVVRLVPGGVASVHLHRLKVGDQVVFTGPYGDFRLSEDPEVEVVCVGGGCGMAPIRSIVRTILHRWPERSCRLFFGARSTRDVFYLEEFQELTRRHPNFQVVYALSDRLGTEERWDGETGFVHLAVDKHLGAGVKRQAFLCGPPAMIEAVTKVLLEKGLTERDIFYDKF